MVTFNIYQVFSNKVLGFSGNTAAVVYLPDQIQASRMQAIAADLCQPATSFLWEEDGQLKVRWFAPDAEIILCGHGALASFAFLREQDYSKKIVQLNYSTGQIKGILDEEMISMSLKAIQRTGEEEVPEAIQDGLSIPVLAMYKTSDKHIIVTDSEKRIISMKPNFSRLRESKIFGYAITAPGEEVDFVSRTLVPHVGQLEDHATGSSHAMLTPYWSKRLKKEKMVAIQHSKRGGYFMCEAIEDLVKLSGEYQMIAKGSVSI